MYDVRSGACCTYLVPNSGASSSACLVVVWGQKKRQECEHVYDIQGSPPGRAYRGVAQERIGTHTACDLVSYAYDIILRRYEIPGICVVACMYHSAA